MAPKSKDPPAPLRPIVLAGCIALLPIALAFFVVGAIGIHILLDAEDSSSLSRSDFGQAYKRLIAMNPFFSAFFLNGGMIGALFAGTKLWEHRAAVKRVKKAARSKKAITGGTTAAAAGASSEAKKDK
ncbi:hypothetical protein Agub_g11815 [Astrephomene gubernaculifera]|uniref:Uncharacterized protein n=1 Tax=Astrephomene gubernaculifera TaxID=47775 RepID=A0AAD3HQ33_9CHLO|nr:hypothetical protein Agub_g11815 [Astrephomene gubernaculifera]